MGKYYYIPTSTLNFNNILSSESLSPKTFYEKRGFGYSRWATIPENDVDNAIILYENKFSFSRPKSDLEDHPMLIEIFTDENFQNIGDGIYFSDHTIYLNPWNTRFVFFSEQDKKITLSMSESSLQTKLIPLYCNRIVTERIENQHYNTGSNIIVDLNNNEIEKDKRIDRLKGLLYGYYIGAYLSSFKESVINLNMLKDVYNIFAAILASFDKKPTQFQLEKLKQIFQTLQTKSQFYQGLSSIINDENKTHQVITYLKLYLKYKDEYDELTLKHLLNSLGTNDSQSETKNQAIAWVENKIENQNKIIEREHKFLQTDSGEIVVIDNKLSEINSIKDDTECELFKAWINDVLSSEKYDGHVSTFKEELSDDITIKAKEVIGEERWNDSSAKIYLNKLRRHVRGEEFDVVWNNGIFSSIAAVIINGDDWDKLLSFMQLHEMYDYRLAFAMFGTLNGFAYLNRDFTDIIIDCNNRDYKANVYKEIYGQLFDKDIIYAREENEVDHTTQRLRLTKQQTPSVSETNEFATPTSDNIEIKISKNADNFDRFFEELAETCPAAKKDIKIYKSLYINHNGFNDEFVDFVKSDKLLNNGKGVQKNVINFLEAKIKNKSKQTSMSFEFSDDNFKFFNDGQAADKVCSALGYANNSKIHNEIEWIQKVHREGGYNRKKGYVKLSYHSSEEMINHFYNNNKRKLDKKTLNDVYQKLKELYL